MDGVDLLPFLTSATHKNLHDQLFWKKYDQQTWTVRKGHEKLLSFRDSSAYYNLEQDISEEHNLVSKKQKEAFLLQEAFTTWDKHMLGPIFLGLNQNKEYNQLHPDRFGKKDENITEKKK